MKRTLLWVVPGLLLAVMAFNLFFSARQTSVTADEFAHVPTGIKYWETGDFATYRQSPPLIRLLAAAPLLASRVSTHFIKGDPNRWFLGLRFMRENWSNYHGLITRARLVIIAITLSAGLILFVVVYRTMGYGPSLVALFLFTFSPSFLAHGGLVTTDAGFCLAFLSTLWVGARYFLRATLARGIALGVVMGIAQLVKFSSVSLYFLFLAWSIFGRPFYVGALREADNSFFNIAWQRRLLQGIAIVTISLFALNAGYLFEGTGTPLSEYEFRHPALVHLTGSFLGSVPCPLPTHFILGIDSLLDESSGAGKVYLLGELSYHGWWFYYPVAMIVKTPLPLFLLLALSLYLTAKGRIPGDALFKGCICLCVLILFMLVFVSTNLNIGIRYLLFMFPFLYMIVARLGKREVMNVLKYRIFVFTCLTWYGISSIAAYPDYLSYFSDLVGGGGNGYKYLADSNLDWGQDLIHLKRVMDKRKIDSVEISHFGLVDPAVYGISYKPYDGGDPQGRVVAVSVNHMLNYYPFRPEIPSLKKLKGLEPTEVIGNSLWLWDLR